MNDVDFREFETVLRVGAQVTGMCKLLCDYLHAKFLEQFANSALFVRLAAIYMTRSARIPQPRTVVLVHAAQLNKDLALRIEQRYVR